MSGLILIGDDCEEDGDDLIGLAQRLGTKRIAVYAFHEQGADGEWSAQEIFEAIAEESGGVYCPFGAESADALRVAFNGGGI